MSVPTSSYIPHHVPTAHPEIFPLKPVPAGTTAPYGRTCLGCVRSKCKCISRGPGEGCQRCHRLKKECQSQSASRKKQAKKPAGSRTLLLEKKLDSIVSLLQASAQSGALPSPPDAAAILQIVNDDVRLVQSAGIPLTPNTIPPNAASPGLDLDQMGLSPSEAEEVLFDFRTQKLKFLPCIYILATTTPEEMLQERPFLWHCIVAMASKSTAQQQVLVAKVRETLNQRMLHESEGSLDLLLGILAFIAWTNCHILQKPALSMFTQLAISLVFDLNLNRPISGQASTLYMTMYDYKEPPRLRTLEERRAVLGTFLLSSIVSSFLQKIDTLRWTPHMDECLQVLEETKECPNDEVLIAQIRLQLLVEKATQISYQNADALPSDPTTFPSTLYIRSLQGQLVTIQDNLPPHLRTNEIILLHIHSTSLTLATLTIPTTLPLSPSTPPLSYTHLTALHSTLATLRLWFDTYFLLPSSCYHASSFALFSQLTHSLVTLFQLSTLRDPAWDTAYVRSTVDVLSILAQVVGNMREAHVLGGKPATGMWERGAEAYERLGRRWGAVLAEVGGGECEVWCGGSGEGGADGGGTVDDGWFSDLFATCTWEDA